MTWLITGGAGYIGAHVVAAMCAAGESVVVLDDLSTGDPARIPAVETVVGSVCDGDLVAQVLRAHDVHGVVHVAAKKQVEESVREPLHYYRENVAGLLTLLEAVTAARVQTFLFSSSAAVYGAPDLPVVGEDADCLPVNPYGETKLAGERLVRAVAEAHGLRHANLRYFNVAGCASPALADRGRTNLVPMVFECLAQGRAPRVFGADYPTPDGTCIRDFVHVADVASAHVAVARALAEGQLATLTANVGRGEGVSVRQMIDLIRLVTGTDTAGWAEPAVEPRRPGDPARVVASADLLRDRLGWSARHDPEEMVRSAWAGWGSPDGAPRGPGERALVPG